MSASGRKGRAGWERDIEKEEPGSGGKANREWGRGTEGGGREWRGEKEGKNPMRRQDSASSDCGRSQKVRLTAVRCASPYCCMGAALEETCAWAPVASVEVAAGGDCIDGDGEIGLNADWADPVVAIGLVGG